MSRKLGVIVIGRNEGNRLRRCLESILSDCDRLVYVDSNSSDNSVAIARSMNLEVLELDLSRPINASRARQEGYNRLLALYPQTEFVFFVDGDCEVSSGWIEKAVTTLEELTNAAVVCGRLKERNPERSIYNRICNLEWDAPVGEVSSTGGIAVMRVQAYDEVGGFDPTVSAGEEPELCYRLRKAGWKIFRIDADMAWHDAAITNFFQWWRREFRTGYGGLDVQMRFGVKDFVRINNSSRIWSTGWPLAVLVALGVKWSAENSSYSTWMLIIVLLLLPVQIARVAWIGSRCGLCVPDSLAYGVIMMASKWPQALGQLKRIREHNSHNNSGLIGNQSNYSTDLDWLADLERYPSRPWLKEQSIWAIAVYRFGRRIDNRPEGFKKKIATIFYWRIFRLVETLTGISLPKEAAIGGGLRIHHFGNIFIHPEVRIGSNCTLRQGVTIGNRIPDGPVPMVGNNVDFGAYAQVLGDVSLGDGVKVGAMSVVLNDVPPASTVVGVPAHIVQGTNVGKE